MRVSFLVNLLFFLLYHVEGVRRGSLDPFLTKINPQLSLSKGLAELKWMSYDKTSFKFTKDKVGDCFFFNFFHHLADFIFFFPGK